MDVLDVLWWVSLSAHAWVVGPRDFAGASVGGRREGLGGTPGWLSVTLVFGGGAPVPAAGSGGVLGGFGGVLFLGPAARLRESRLSGWEVVLPRSVCRLCAGGRVLASLCGGVRSPAVGSTRGRALLWSSGGVGCVPGLFTAGVSGSWLPIGFSSVSLARSSAVWRGGLLPWCWGFLWLGVLLPGRSCLLPFCGLLPGGPGSVVWT